MIFSIIGQQRNVILILLDLSAAFEMVDHEILMKQLEYWVGLKGNVLKWFKSYLTEKSFLVSMGNCFSSKLRLSWGVPQGSILAPLLFFAVYVTSRDYI